jgi:hypothetical protein
MLSSFINKHFRDEKLETGENRAELQDLHKNLNIVILHVQELAQNISKTTQ